MCPDRFRPPGRPQAAPVRRCRAAAASPRCAPRPRSAPRWRPPCCPHRPGGGTPRPDRPGAWRRGHCSRPAKLLRPPRYPRSCGRARGGPRPARPRRPAPASRQAAARRRSPRSARGNPVPGSMARAIRFSSSPWAAIEALSSVKAEASAGVLRTLSGESSSWDSGMSRISRSGSCISVSGIA